MTPGHLAVMMSWLTLAVSVVALAIVGLVQWTRAKKAEEDLKRQRAAVAEISAKTEDLRTNLSRRNDDAKRLRGKIMRREAIMLAAQKAGVGVDDAPDDRHEVDSRMEHFLNLVDNWKRATGLTLAGVARADWSTIDDLTNPSLRRGSNETEASFTLAARRLVEYAVITSAKPLNAVDEQDLDRLLAALAGLVNLKLITPMHGERFNSKLHQFERHTPAGGNQRETIAKVVERGLIAQTGSVMRKARVHLYD